MAKTADQSMRRSASNIPVLSCVVAAVVVAAVVDALDVVVVVVVVVVVGNTPHCSGM